VDANLEAAATPIAVESTAGEKPDPRKGYTQAAIEDGWTPQEAEWAANAEAGMAGAFDERLWNSPSARQQSRRGADMVRKSNARSDAFDASLAEAYGHNYVPPEAHVPGLGGRSRGGQWRSEPFGPERLYGEGVPNWAQGAFDTGEAVIDGVTVPTYDLGDFQARYQLGDVRRAQEAAADARWLAGHRALIDSENARYGHYSIRDGADELTPEQQEARYNRKRAEGRQAAQREASRQYQIANKDRELTPYEQQQKDRRGRVAARAMLAGGSEHVTGANDAMLNAMLTLSPEERQRNLQYATPGGQAVALVDAEKAKAAGDVAKVGVMNREVDARLAAMESQAEQMRADRATQHEQFLERMAAERAAREQQALQFQAGLQRAAESEAGRFALTRQEAEQRHAAMMAQLGQARSVEEMRYRQAEADRQARERIAADTNDVERGKYEGLLEKDRRKADDEMAMAARGREFQFQTQSPGEYDVMTGSAGTANAIRELKRLASQSEDSWTEDILDPMVYLSLGFADSGFDSGNAVRMNDELLRMANKAKLLGIESKLHDPAYRRDLINKYGFNSGWAGGQGGWMGSLWRTMPPDLR
jgi:hypothetical protein